MTGDVFVDSNVWCYTVDYAEPEKQSAAITAIKPLVEADKVVVSAQVLSETYTACVRKIGLDPVDARRLVHSISQFNVVAITAELVQQAIEISLLSRIKYWDALIIAAAKAGGCRSLLSEDLNPGQVVEGVRVFSPFTV